MLIIKKRFKRYYLPFYQKLMIKQKNNSQMINYRYAQFRELVKTKQGQILEILLTILDTQSISLSIDDHYLTHKELNKLREMTPAIVRRGVTHDICACFKKFN